MGVNGQLRRQSYVPSNAATGVPASMGGGVSAQVSMQGNVGEGQAALVVLMGATVFLVLFYVSTRKVQGGG